MSTRHDVVAGLVQLRDGNECQYCGKRGPVAALPVVPPSAGGPYAPFNVVATCADCEAQHRSHVTLPVNFNTITRQQLPFRRKAEQLEALPPPVRRRVKATPGGWERK